MIVLDTDHVSALQHRNSPAGDRLRAYLCETHAVRIAVTAITLDEQCRGWLSRIRSCRNSVDQVPFYARLTSLFDFFSEWDILPFDLAAAAEFERLKTQRPRLGAMDLKIAAVTLVHEAQLLSRNLRDFEQIDGLAVEDWLTES